MPKKKKTRKQKEQADVRRYNEPTVRLSTPISESQKVHKPQLGVTHEVLSPSFSTTNTVAIEEHKYLGRDLGKTLILTTAIIGLELVLKFAIGL